MSNFSRLDDPELYGSQMEKGPPQVAPVPQHMPQHMPQQMHQQVPQQVPQQVRPSEEKELIETILRGQTRSAHDGNDGQKNT
jgi:hypothetical protein